MKPGDRVSFMMNGYQPNKHGHWTAYGTVIEPTRDGRGWLVRLKGNPASVHACATLSGVVRVQADNIKEEQ